MALPQRLARKKCSREVTKVVDIPEMGMNTVGSITLHRITMHVSQLLPDLALTPHVEVVVTSLPEVFSFADEPFVQPTV